MGVSVVDVARRPPYLWPCARSALIFPWPSSHAFPRHLWPGAANLYAGTEEGVHVIDSAAGGLGGCPFAPGATGNVATEDIVYMKAWGSKPASTCKSFWPRPTRSQL